MNNVNRPRTLMHSDFKYIKREWVNGKWRYYYNTDKAEINSGLKRGGKGDQVKAVQTVLKKTGYDLGKSGVDGIIGNKTESAVKRFQKNNRLKETGVVDDPTLAAMERVSKAAVSNKYSRNMPGSSASEPNTGKGMSELQRSKAKYMAKAHKDFVRNNGKVSNFSSTNYRDVATKEWHKNQLDGSNSRTTAHKEAVKTTKKQIRRGIRRAKVKTIIRKGKKAIARAQSWLNSQFD